MERKEAHEAETGLHKDLWGFLLCSMKSRPDVSQTPPSWNQHDECPAISIDLLAPVHEVFAGVLLKDA